MIGDLVAEAPGVRSWVIDLFPKDKNRETEVSRGFRYSFLLYHKTDTYVFEKLIYIIREAEI